MCGRGRVGFSEGPWGRSQSESSFGGLKADLHHGVLNGLFLPAVLAYNEGHAEEPYEAIRAVVGSNDLPAFFARLLDEIGLPTRLSDLGVTDDDLQRAAPLAAADHCTPTNPRALTEADALALYRSCL